MQTTAFASLIALALVLVVACFTIGNPWIGSALLLVLGAFAYNHLRFTRAFLHLEHLWACSQLRSVDRLLARAQEAKYQAQNRFDYIKTFDMSDEIDALNGERRKLVARILRLDFELEH